MRDEIKVYLYLSVLMSLFALYVTVGGPQSVGPYPTRIIILCGNIPIKL